MRIPLDYYQILGVAFDATPEQIQQSFEDRLQQLPKQQYSTFAIASRKKLLQEAHGILLNPKRRQEHDQDIFPEEDSSAEDLTTAAHETDVKKGIDIDSNYLAGALILLLEFGEFDAVLALGLGHLNRPIDLQKVPSEASPNDDDVALAVSIAHLELGREHWQQDDCEQAGQCLQTGLKILRDEGKFLDIQAEIRKDLSKLRPYRVLDLLALDLEDLKRADGLSMLQDMLDERGGMEGNGDDQSGLSINDFLLFMQQLRDHLTVDEQFNLFKAESMRPSSVASYLSVYTHVAKGVSEYNPQLISQAKSLLSSLSDRQDLNLEQGMCSLLLGQPDAAAHFVQQSTDEDALSFIADYSEGAPDIIPGLYLYTEQWLQQEVYPYFRDLGEQAVSLESYFNDPDVQRQLSDLEPDLPNLDQTWNADKVNAKWQQWLEEKTKDSDIPPADTSPLIEPTIGDEGLSREPETMEEEQSPNWFSELISNKVTVTEETAEAPLQWSEPPQDNASTAATAPPSPPVQKPNNPQGKTKTTGQSERLSKSSKTPSQRQSRPFSNQKKKPWITWAAFLLLGVSALWGIIAIGKLFQSAPSPSPPPQATPTSPASEPSPPPTSPTPPDSSVEVSDNGALSKEAAQEIIQAWQKIKSEALGNTYQIEGLSQILIEPALSRWQYSADVSKDEGKYTTYSLKQLTINSVTMDTPTVATVRATIEEKRDQYSAGGASPFASLEDSYQVDYRLESVDGKWRIKEMNVIE